MAASTKQDKKKRRRDKKRSQLAELRGILFKKTRNEGPIRGSLERAVVWVGERQSRLHRNIVKCLNGL